MKEYFGDIFKGIWTILIGMKVTFRHLFVPSVTIQYPDARRPIPERARNRLYVNMDDCIGCDQCSAICPVSCIEIETVKSVPGTDLGTTSTGQKKRLWVTKFDIDIAKCCYCGLCVPPCPTECIKMTDVFEFSEYDRKNLVYNYVTIDAATIADVKEKAAEMAKEAAAKKAAAAAQAKAAAAAKTAGGTPVPSPGSKAPASGPPKPAPAPTSPPSGPEKTASGSTTAPSRPAKPASPPGSGTDPARDRPPEGGTPGGEGR